MPRKSKAQRKKELKTASALIGALLAAILCALMLAFPGFTDWVFSLTGVQHKVVVPLTGSNSAVAVHVIDVGQGSATLLKDNGTYALLDCGPPPAQDTLVAYLEAAGVKKLDYVILTHPHDDHYGGMEAVLRHFEVGTVVLPDLTLAPYPTTSSFLKLVEAMNELHLKAETGKPGAVYHLGQGEIEIIHGGLASTDNHNLLSLGLRYHGEDLQVLVTGDAEKANEAAMLEDGAPLRANVFISGHHGSSTSNTAAFVKAVSPEIVVVSCAAGNSYGHPHNSALRAFEKAGAKVFRTDKSGSMVIQPQDGQLAYGVEKTAA